VLEENSPILHQELLDLANQLSSLYSKPELHLELAQMHLMYHSIVPALTELQAALKTAGITLDLSGNFLVVIYKIDEFERKKNLYYFLFSLRRCFG